jgi:hypothetical protein
MEMQNRLTVASMKKGLDKAEVAYTKFMLYTRNGIEGLYCFFESERGSDNAYYVPRIKQFINDYHPINCGGRDKVLRVHALIKIHEEYDKYKKAFFIDKDFNTPLTPQIPPFFETQCYSIENYYVSVEVFKEILKNNFQISEVDEAFHICISLFTERQKEYHEAAKLFNAWYACLIDIRNSEGKQTGVNLDDKLPKGFLDFSLEKISKKYDLDIIKATFENATECPLDKLEAKIIEFTNCDQSKIFRGKYELTFVRDFLQMLIQDSNTAKKFLKNKIASSFSPPSNDQALTIFSAFAETPENLRLYLTEVTK